MNVIEIKKSIKKRKMRKEVISEYLAYLNIPITKKDYVQSVISHPRYPSLLSISDTLEGFGIRHKVVRIAQEHLSKMSFPYILQFDKKGGILALIKNKKELNAHEKDMKYWSGVIIKAEPTQKITSLKHKMIRCLSRTIHGYCLGAAKTGTTTIHHMFNKRFHSAHEPIPQETIQLVIDFLENKLSKTKVAKILKERDELLNLEMESNHLLSHFSEIFVDIFPEAKYIITIREPYNHLNSRLNSHLHPARTWKPYLNYFFTRNHKGFEPEEQILKKKKLFSLNTYLQLYASHYNRVLSNIPEQKRTIIRTDKLNNLAGILSLFFNIDKSSLQNSHANANNRKINILEQLDEDFVRKKIWKYCSNIIAEYFPETLRYYDKRGL